MLCHLLDSARKFIGGEVALNHELATCLNS